MIKLHKEVLDFCLLHSRPEKLGRYKLSWTSINALPVIYKQEMPRPIQEELVIPAYEI